LFDRKLKKKNSIYFVYIVNVFTVNNDKLNDSWCIKYSFT